jgi:GNAT superfamily N-acetyltransferase
VIRRATVADAEPMVALRARAWTRAYADFLDVESALDDRDEQLGRWRERLSSGEPAAWVWEQAGRIAGYVAASGGQVRALYVDPPAQGAGVGSALLGVAEAHLAESGHSRAELDVFVLAAQARAFYEHRGWSAIEGSEYFDPATGTGGLRYRRAL